MKKRDHAPRSPRVRTAREADCTCSYARGQKYKSGHGHSTECARFAYEDRTYWKRGARDARIARHVLTIPGERNMANAGYRWDVFANFLCNTTNVRVGMCKTKRGAWKLAERFEEVNREFGCEHVYIKRRYDPLLNLMNHTKNSRRRP